MQAHQLFWENWKCPVFRSSAQGVAAVVGSWLEERRFPKLELYDVSE